MNEIEIDPTRPAILTKDDAASVLGTSHRHVRRLIAEGSLPAVKLGGLVRIRRVDLHAYVERLGDMPRSTALGAIGGDPVAGR